MLRRPMYPVLPFAGDRPHLGSPASPLLPNGTYHGTQHEDGADGNEPGDETEDHANGSVQLAVGDDRGGKVEMGEHSQPHPEDRSRNSGTEESPPGFPARQQEMNGPPEEQCQAHQPYHR